MKIIELKAFRRESGNCFVANIPNEAKWCDNELRPCRSPARLFENWREIGTPHSEHDLIRQLGAGRFSHWNGELYFSSSDNSVAGRNGRRYHLLVAETDADCFTASSATPKIIAGNFQARRVTPEEANNAFEYGLRIANSYVSALPNGVRSLRARRVLEVGPGLHFVTPLLLLAWGAASITLADRFLASHFIPEYHAPIYSRLLEYLSTRSNINEAVRNHVSEMLERSTHEVGCLTLVPEGLEELSKHTKEKFDLTLSNAVFEHLRDPQLAFEGLRRVSAPESIGLHQVDFRDHRDFDRPLESLLMSDAAFLMEFDQTLCEIGNRLRPLQYAGLLESAGFLRAELVPNMWADASYLKEFLARLRGAFSSGYCVWPLADLEVISGQFRLAG
jgi:SAM-dependent methyltransferase